MGAVYRATDEVLQRTVAIKILKDRGDNEVAKIRLEAQILARLLHNHVVRIYDFGEASGIFFLVMEEVDGSSYQRRWHALSLLERLTIQTEVADALDYAHHQGVIHRDVKPGNVLLTASHQSKLSDFGLSMIADQGDTTGQIRGTPHYMSPEQAQGRKLDHRSDLYSLGVMLYESATGSVPFMGKSLAVLSQHISAKPDPPRVRNASISPTLESLILQLLEKDPDRRPVSGGVVANALREEIEQERLNQGLASTQVSLSRIAAEAGAMPTERPSLLAGSPPTVAPLTAPATTLGSTSLGQTAGATTFAATSLTQPPVPPANALLGMVLAEPMILTPSERFLCGHYLAYLLGGSRRRGLLLRRPLDIRNADRARLMLAMAAVMLEGASDESVAIAARLLEERPDIRSSLSPVVVAKYLAMRDTPAKRKKFRQARRRLQEVSPYAQKHMTDPTGVLNPGLMPASLDDLRKIAPEQIDVDDQLVERWNRVSDVWRGNPTFRNAVLLYTSRTAARNPASFELWPEVVYPLIERARWQRQIRTRAELMWDYFSSHVLHVPGTGVRLDQAMRMAIPQPLVAELDVALGAFEDEPLLDGESGPLESQGSDRLVLNLGHGGVNLHELASDRAPSERNQVWLASPDPHRFLLGELRALWEEAVAGMRSPDRKAGHKHVPVGPYRLVVIASIRGRSAGQVVIQGMPNKQIEMLTPSIRLGGSAGKPLIAVWVYQDNSLAIAYVGFKGDENYILWHAPNGQQFNFTDPGEFNHMLYQLGMEIPDQADRVLTKRFRPRNPV
jgi:serine/threonine-protein kinase